MTSEQLKVLIEQARIVAKAAHTGQTRRNGGDLKKSGSFLLFFWKYRRWFFFLLGMSWCLTVHQGFEEKSTFQLTFSGSLV